MKRIIGLCLVTVLVFAGFGLGGVKTQAEDELRDFEKNARWYFSGEDLRTASPIYKIMDAVVGVPVKAKFFVINNQKVNISYKLGFDLTDNGNREAWMEGDRKSLQLDKSKFTLKPGQKQDVTVTVTVNKSHSGHAFWTLNIIPDKGTKDNVFLYVCQYDTKAEITYNYTPPKVKNMTELLKYKTKIGYIINTRCFSVVTYGNKHVYCFNMDGTYRWTYRHERTIWDFGVEYQDSCENASFILLDTKLLNPLNGQSNERLPHSEYQGPGEFFADSKNMLIMFDYAMPEWMSNFGYHMLVCKPYLHGKISWILYSELYSFRFPYMFKSVPNRIMFKQGSNCEDCPRIYKIIDPRNGNILIDAGFDNTFGGFVHTDDKNKIFITAGMLPYPKSNNEIKIWDVEACKNVLNYKACGATNATISDNLVIYSDFKHTSCFDYVNRKTLWTLKGDGAPLCEPVVDSKREYFYILDEDSTWAQGDYSARIVTAPKFVRLYKFNLKTGKQIWHTNIFSIPKEEGTFLDYKLKDDLSMVYRLSNDMTVKNEKIVIDLDVNGNKKHYTFTIRASDGTFIK